MPAPASVVAPVPAIEPPLHARLFAVTVPVPLNVPPDTFSVPGVNVPSAWKTPPLTASVPPLKLEPPLNTSVPPVLLSRAPAPSVRLPLLLPPPARFTVLPAVRLPAPLLLNWPLIVTLPVWTSSVPPLFVKLTLLAMFVVPAPTVFLNVPAFTKLVAAPPL